VQFDDEQIAAVKKIYTDWQTGEGYADVPELCKSATKEEIASQNYSLAPSKYIEFIDHDRDIDTINGMKWLMDEINSALSEEQETVRLLELAVAGGAKNVE
jgi:type I restriction enzyme M protein